MDVTHISIMSVLQNMSSYQARADTAVLTSGHVSGPEAGLGRLSTWFDKLDQHGWQTGFDAVH